jgi:hypothetical protein
MRAVWRMACLFLPPPHTDGLAVEGGSLEVRERSKAVFPDANSAQFSLHAYREYPPP